MNCPKCGSVEVKCWASGLCSCSKCGYVWDKNEKRKKT
jgi:ribosomal protein L37AE/L43A